MDEKLNVEETGLGINIEPKEEKSEEAIQEEIQQLLQQGDEEFSEEDDLDKKNYSKVSPTFYVRSVGVEDSEDGEEKIEIFKVLNPETGVVEKRALTDEENQEIYVLNLKESRKVFKPVKHPVKTTRVYTPTGQFDRLKLEKTSEVVTNELINPYGTKYKQKRKRKNTLTKKSRKANRK